MQKPIPWSLYNSNFMYSLCMCICSYTVVIYNSYWNSVNFVLIYMFSYNVRTYAVHDRHAWEFQACCIVAIMYIGID